MTPEQLKHFDELIEQAIRDTAVHVKNTTERTNSGLVAEIMTKMRTELGAEVKLQLNGQLVDIKKTLKEQNDTTKEQNEITHIHFEKVDAHMVKVEEYLPMMKSLASVSDGGRIVGKFVIFLGAVGAAVLAIKAWIK